LPPVLLLEDYNDLVAMLPQAGAMAFRIGKTEIVSNGRVPPFPAWAKVAADDGSASMEAFGPK
jgi:hypothetical protein